MKFAGGRLTLHRDSPVSSDDVARVSSNAGPVCGRAVAGGCRACSRLRPVLLCVCRLCCAVLWRRPSGPSKPAPCWVASLGPVALRTRPKKGKAGSRPLTSNKGKSAIPSGRASARLGVSGPQAAALRHLVCPGSGAALPPSFSSDAPRQRALEPNRDGCKTTGLTSSRAGVPRREDAAHH